MKTAIKTFSWAVLLSGTAGLAAAQEAASPPAATAPAKSAPKSSAQIDAGEPRANVSASPAASPSGDAARRAAPAASGSPAAPASTPPAGRGRPAGGAGAKPGDRLELGTATVTGEREQPKVMYIVPWKKSDIGDLSGKPMNSLLDEALAPVDRDEFKREVAYYNVVNADAPQKGAPSPAAKQGEK
jgi:hypothetical protein